MIMADDIMVIGYQEDEQDHDIAFTKLLETTKEEQYQTKFQQNSIQTKRNGIFWQNNHNTGM